jgi:lysophospholipase L1-like esterase
VSDDRPGGAVAHRLSTDLVHPADGGMVRMNERLADRLADLV